MSLRSQLYILFIILLSHTQALFAQTFTRIDAGFPVCHHPAAAWADIDNDGDLDVFLAGLDETDTPGAWLFLNSSGSFTPVSTSINGIFAGDCAFGDFNNDGLADLALSGMTGSGPETKVYRNDGGGVFTDIGAGIDALSESAIAWGDYDNDGWTDLIISGENSSSQPVTILYNNDEGTSFTASGISFTGLAFGSLAWSDIDLDLDLDLVITGLNDSQEAKTLVYLNDNGTFTLMNAGLNGLKGSTASWGDYNNDTYPDLLISGAVDDNTPSTFVYKNNAGVSFSALAGPFDGIVEGSAIWGDFTNNGSLDFILSGGRGFSGGGGPPVPTGPAELKLYINQGNDQFLLQKIQLNGSENSDIVCGDYDNDSDLDLLMNGTITSSISLNNGNAAIYRNETGNVNSPPSAPNGMVFEITGDEILFSWNASTDDKTPSNGLNYNLRVGTSDVNMDIYSALADLGNGYRHIVSTGNTGGNLSSLLTDLDFGAYHASVQAIDHDYAASDFSSTVVVEIVPTATFLLEEDTLCVLEETDVTYTGNASASAQYNWDFDGATLVSGSGPGPYVVYWDSDGIKTVSLTVTENGVTSTPFTHEVQVIAYPTAAGFIAGPSTLCQGINSTGFVVPPIAGATSYEWHLNPVEAGMISGNGMQATVFWAQSFIGTAYVFVRGVNYCGPGAYSDSLDVLINPIPGKPGQAAGPSELCLNNPNTSYTATGATYGDGYQWYLLPEEAGIVFGNGLEAEIDWDNTYTGQAKIFLNAFNNCGLGPASDTLYINISIPPGADAGDDQQVPYGNTTQLFGTGSGGSGSYNYYWMPDSLLTNPSSAEPTSVSLLQSAQFTLSVSDDESGCTAYDQMIVTITGGPLSLNVMTDPDTICAGDESQLLALAGGGTGNYTYIWTSDPPGFTSNIANPLVTPEENTWYFVELSDGVETLNDSIFINVFPTPEAAGNISGPQEVCNGSEQVLYEIDPIPDAETYLWILSEGMLGSSNGTSILVTFSGSILERSISVSGANSCGLGSSSSINVLIIAPPETPLQPSGPDSLCTSTDTISTYTIDNSVTSDIAYEWALQPEEAGVIHGNGPSADVYWTQNWAGEAEISVRAMNECGYSDWTEPFAVHTFNCLGIGDPGEDDISLKIYPNPSGGVLHVEFTHQETSQEILLNLWDIYGRKMISRRINAKEQLQHFDISSLPDGLYILTLSAQDRLLANRKIVLNK